MTVSSMTGFSRGGGENDRYRWVWEIKSVNGRGLDVRCRLPNGFDELEPIVRQAAQSMLKRGNVQAGLSLTRHAAATKLEINTEVLSQVLVALNQMSSSIEASPPTLDGILAIKGVMDLSEGDEKTDERAATLAALETTMRETLTGLQQSRLQEGAKLNEIVSDQVDQIDGLVDQAKKLAADQPNMLAEKLKTQLDAILENAKPVDENRLAQEIAMLATRADIAEELDRLKAHVEGAHGLLTEEQAIGRKLDFLTQELNREANTICSKSNHLDLTRIGLELKAVIDQMREQVQNIE